MRDVLRFDAEGSEIHILPVIRGLTDEVGTVSRAFDEVRPDAVAVSISTEELDGLRNLPEDFEPVLSRYDEIYVKGLSRYGEVAAPPPCYLAALELADEKGLRVFPIDIDEASYTELYCASVSGSTLFRHSTRTWLLKRRSFAADSAEDYVRKLDRAFNNMSGFKSVERERSRWMARELLRLSKKAERLLAAIEFERAEDVFGLLESGPVGDKERGEPG